MTAQTIITQARERLGDIKKQRWTDDRLISIVSQGQVDICLETGYLRKHVVLSLTNGESIYSLPRDCYSIKRVEYDGKLLPLHTRNDQDSPRAITTEYVAYKSNLSMRKLEIQPEISQVNHIKMVDGTSSEDSNFVVTPIFGVITSTNSDITTIAPLYGVTTGLIMYQSDNVDSTGYGEVYSASSNLSDVETPNGIYGVLTDLSYADAKTYGFISNIKGQTVSGTYGLTGNVSYAEDTFSVYYVAVPDKLTYLGATLVMPELWEDILIRYTVGTALQDDNDSNNITRGEAELQKYAVKLAKIADLSSKDFSANTSDKNETDFRSI